MTCRGNQAEHRVAGKTSEQEDQFEGKFKLLVPNQKIVEEVIFTSMIPAFKGA